MSEKSADNPDRWGYVLPADVLSPGEAITVRVGPHWIAIGNDKGRYFACDNACPHANGSLGKGEVRDGCIYCPVHRWPWDLHTGLTDPGMPWLRLKLIPCECHDNKIFIDLNALASGDESNR